MPIKALPRTLPAFFWHFLKPQWGSFLVLTITMVGWAVQEAAYPYFIRLVVDHLTQHTAEKATIFSSISTILLSWAALWLTIEIGYRTYDFLSAKVYPRFQANIRTALFEYTMHHSYQFFADRLAGSISNRITRMSDVMLNIVTTILTIFWPVIIAFLLSIIILFQTQPIFGFIMATWVVLHFGAALYFTQQCSKLSTIHSKSLNTLSGKIVDTLSNMATVRLFARNRFELSYFSRFQKEEVACAYDLQYYDAKMKMCLGLASQAFIFIMVAVGIYAWRENLITLGELAQILASLQLIGLAWYMGMNLIKIYEDIGVCQESLTLVKEPHGIIDQKPAKVLTVSHGEIKFDNVTFHYSTHHKLFKEKNVTLKAGEKVGLVGFSGSGKTTFVNLILRHFDVEKGRILIDDQDITSVSQDSLRSQIALIPQDATLFHRTLLENIRYGKTDATEAEVIQAAKKAHCHEFIKHLEFGYETLVGERGIKLSGGQRQRIAIARAILKNAPILILDEATSALDSVTEKYIQESLNLLMEKRTAIVIAHRLSTLVGMDRILVFKEGRIIEDGTHESLLAAQGHYAHLWEMQAYGFLPDSASNAVDAF